MTWSQIETLQSPKGRIVTIAGAVVLFGLIFTLALWVEHPRGGLLHLHAVPIAVLALQLGVLAGLSAVAASLSLMFVWAEMEGAELLMVDYMSGAVPFLVVVLLCQLVLVRMVGRGGGSTNGKASARLRRPHTPELTERERDVLGLLALGHTNREVAETLFLSVRTVESHRARIQQKLGISGRAELVRYAMEHGLAGEPPVLLGDAVAQQAG
jgi:DNA-binding CsgD family transcriptional regulator